MPQQETSANIPSNEPTCEKCGSVMWRATTAALARNPAKSMFECPVCEVARWSPPATSDASAGA
jgi:hypothetical protein